MEVHSGWYETLPDQCPPGEAMTPNGFVCYRLCESKSAVDKDFLSHRHLFPHKTFYVPECRARSISVYKDQSDLDKVLMLPAHKAKTIVRVTLNPQDGATMKTGKTDDSHYSWWRSNSFDMSKSIEVVS